MHGSDYAWGPESTSAFTGCAASDGALWLLVESGGGQTLCRYVYDPAKTVENTLTVYSLEESALMRQAIAEWNNLHPETRIEYTVGMTNAEGTGATREDVIRQLNTELLAGTGPDLLILDGLAGDSLIRQGLLTDLTGLADWSAVRENVLAAYTREDGLYAVPMGMRAYIVGGRPDTVIRISIPALPTPWSKAERRMPAWRFPVPCMSRYLICFTRPAPTLSGGTGSSSRTPIPNLPNS